jgi:hypothetical protein
MFGVEIFHGVIRLLLGSRASVELARVAREVCHGGMILIDPVTWVGHIIQHGISQAVCCFLLDWDESRVELRY